MFSMKLELEAVHALRLCGGATESIFPKVEALLIAGDSQYLEALEFVGKRKNMRRYKSVMDFFFCELFPEFKGACFRFYDERGPQLKDMITIEQLHDFSNKLLIALDLATTLLKAEKWISWEKFRIEALAA